MGAGGVAAGVEDAGRGVSALAGEGDLAVLGVERDAEAHEVVDAVGGLLGEDAGGVGIDEAGAGGERVVEVLAGRIARPDRRGDAALGPARVAVVHGAFGDDEHGAVLAGEEGGVQPGYAGADDDVVVGGAHFYFSASTSPFRALSSFSLSVNSLINCSNTSSPS